MNGLLSETARDIVNLTSLALGLASLLLTRPHWQRTGLRKGSARISADRARQTFREVVSVPSVRNLLLTECGLLVTSTWVFLPLGVPRLVLGLAGLVLFFVQAGFCVAVVAMMFDTHEMSGTWGWPLMFVMVILASTAIFSLELTPLRTFLLFQIGWPCICSVFGLLGYVYLSIGDFLDSRDRS